MKEIYTLDGRNVHITNCKKTVVIFLAILFCLIAKTETIIAQCTSSNQSGSSPVAAINTGVAFTWTQNANSYLRVTGVTNGTTYKISSSNSTDFITIRTANTGGIVIASGTNPLTFTSSISGTLYIIVSTNNSCGTSNTNRTISMAAKPVVSSFPLSGCVGSSITITGTSLAGVTSVSFNGTNVSPSSTSSTSVTVVIPTGATTGPISVTGSGGTTTSATNFTVNSLPSVTNFSTSATSPCLGSGSTVTINSTSLGSGTYTVAYNLSGANSVTGNTASLTITSNTGQFIIPAASLSNSGSTTVTITSVQNSNGCSSSPGSGQTATFTVNSLPNVSNFATSASALCMGSANAIKITSSSLGNGTYTVTYNLSGANSATGNIATLTMSGGSGTFNTSTLNNSGSTTVTITSVQNSNGCGSSPGTGQTATFTVNSLPDVSNFATSAPASNVCAGSTNSIKINSLSLGNGTFTVTYNLSGANSATGNTATLTMSGGSGTFNTSILNNSGSTTITITSIQNNSSTCSSITSAGNTAIFTVDANPTTASAGSDQTICITQTSTSLSANTPLIGTGTWSVVSGPNTSNTQFSNVNSPNATFTYAGGLGTYVLAWTISNGTCSSSSDNINVVVVSTLSGTYSVGSSSVTGESGHFASLTAAAATYNNACLGGNVTFVLTNTSYSSGETFPITFNNVGASSSKTLTIKPNTGVTATISGSNSSAILELNGADYITIDGSNNGSASRDLTIKNTSISLLATGSTVVWIASSSSSDGATNNTIKNCTITGSGTTTSWAGINSGSNSASTSSQASASNSNNTIQNCVLSNAVNGIYIYGASTMDQSWSITNNFITSGYSAGILMQYANAFSISGNSVSGITANAIINGNTSGIEITGNATNFTISNNTVSGVINSGAFISGGTAGILIGNNSLTATISGNTISNISNTGGTLATNTDGIKITGSSQALIITGNTVSGVSASANTSPAIGIEFSGTSVGTNSITNNKISSVTQSNNSSGAGYGAEGIYLGATGSPTIYVYNNFISNVSSYGSTGTPNNNNNGYGIAINSGGGYKIYYNSINLTTNQTTGTSAALFASNNVTTSGAIDLRNNIFVNNQTSGAAVASRYSIYSGAAKAVYSNIDYNDYWTATGTNLGFIGSNRSNLNAIQTGFGSNLNSINIQPNFTSATDLHLTNDNNCALNGAATPIANVSTDIDNDARDATHPDIGADEFMSTGITLTVADPSTACSPGTVNLTASSVTAGSSSGITLTYWTDAGATTALSNPSAVSASGTYYIKATKGSCSSSIMPVSVTVNPAPTAAFNGSTSINTCYGTTASLTITGTPSASVTYTINGVTQPSIQLDPSGNYTLTTGAITGSTTYALTSVANLTTLCTATPSSGAAVNISVTSGSYTWTGLTSSNWHTASNWCSGNVPGTTSSVTIPSGTPYSPVISTANANAGSITIASGATLTMTGGYNLTLANAGSFANNGGFDATGSTGAVVFAGSGTISGTTTFKNVIINGSVDFGTASTITGNLLLNSGGAAIGTSTHLITYGSASSLTYNETVTIGNEWYQGGSGTIAAGSGVPQDVIIQSGTVTIPNSGGTNRAVAGNLTIGSGTTLQLTSGTTRDLFIAGNWTNNGGSFTANGRRVTFDAASGIQTVSGNTTFFDVTLNNSGVTTDFSNSTITINDEFRITAGTMNGNTSNFIFTGAASALEGIGSKNFYNLQINSGAILSDLTASAGNSHIANSFINNGAFNQNTTHTFYFDNSGAIETFSGTGTTSFGKLTIGDGSGLSGATTLNCSANFAVNGGSLSFFHNSIYNGNNNTATFSTNSAIISGSGIANFYNATTNVALNLGSGISTINNNLTINANGSIVTNAPVYGSGATLIYNTTTPSLNTSIEWTSNSGSTGAGAPYNVTVQNANSVVLTGSRTVPGTLAVATGNSLDINGNTLTVNTGFSGNGNLKGSATSGLITSGTGTAYFSSNPYNQLKTLTVKTGGDLTLGGDIASGDTLNIVGGNSTDGYGTVTVDGILHTGNLLALKSDANGTAMVGPSSGNIFDEVTVERYFPALRAWRFVAIPFSSTSQTINSAWQEGWVNSVLQCPSQFAGTTGSGTEISGGSPADGFDVNNTGYASIKVYQNNGWVIPASTYSNLVTASSNNAYGLFVRGDRNVCLTTTSTPDATTLRSRGILNEHNSGADATINFSGAKPGDFIFIGNPYAAPIDVEGAVSLSGRYSGISFDKFWVWNPALGGTLGVGGYVTFSGGLQVPFDLNGDATALNTVIQDEEAFMVQVSNSNTPGAGYITLKESDKSTTEQIAGVFGLKASPKERHRSAPPALYVNLLDQNNAIMDGIGVGFGNKYSVYIDSMDTQKKWNEEIENMAIVHHDTTLVIEFRPVAKQSDTVLLRMYLRQHPYTLQIFTRGVREDLPAQGWLVDNYLGTQTLLDLYQTNLYTFTPNKDTNSYRNRFMIVFNRTGKQQQQQDKGIKTGTKAVVANDSNMGGEVNVYPNPVSGSKTMLSFKDMPAGNYEVAIYNAAGKQLSVSTIWHTGNSASYTLSIQSSWTSGIYNIRIVNAKGSSIKNIPFMINR